MNFKPQAHAEFSIEIAMGVAKNIVDGTLATNLTSFGLTEEDLETVCGNGSWLGSQRQYIRRTLDAMMFGIQEERGIPRIMLGAEVIAACLAILVRPINIYQACNWCERLTPGVEQIALGDPDSFQRPITQDQLFAMVCMMYSQESIKKLAASFRKRNQLQEMRAEVDGEVVPEKPKARGRAQG